jgi:hypothetical protein
MRDASTNVPCCVSPGRDIIDTGFELRRIYMAEEGKKRSKKGILALLAAAVGGLFFFLKKRKRAGEESGWEEATPSS